MPGAKLSIFLSWCQIVCLLAWCQIVCFFYLGTKLSYHHILSSKMYLTGPLIYSSIQEIWFCVTFSLPATFIFTRVFNRLKVWILCQSYFVNLHQQGTKSCHNNKHTKIETRGEMAAPNRMNFRRSSNGGEGSFSIQKFMVQIYWELKTQLFEQKEKNQGSGYFFFS